MSSNLVIKVQIIKDNKILILSEFAGQRLLEMREGFPIKNEEWLMAALDLIRGAMGEEKWRE